MSDTAPPNWKIDPALRDRLGVASLEPIDITVETAPDLPGGTHQALVARGLQRSGTTRSWRGTIAVSEIVILAALDGVTYLSSEALPESPQRRPSRLYRPPKPAKRGHTKLPPRRD